MPPDSINRSPWNRILSSGLSGGPLGLLGAPDQRAVSHDRRRSADEIALHHVAAFVGEEAELFLGFHAFGNDRYMQTVTQADHRANDRRRLRVASEVHDETAIDLDLVERKRLQIG